MNNQELLYKIATDQRYADTFRLAIQVQASLQQMRKTAEVDEGVRSTIAAGKKRHEDNKKQKAEAQKGGNRQGGRGNGGGRRSPQRQEPAKQEQQNNNNQHTAKPTVTPEQAFDRGKTTGYGQAAGSALFGAGGALAGRYTLGGIGSQIGRLIAWARNSGARSVLNGFGRQSTVPVGPAGTLPNNSTTFTPTVLTQGYTQTGNAPITRQMIRNGMTAQTNAYRQAGSRIGRGIGTWAGGIGGLALSGVTNSWLSNLIKNKMGGAA